MLRDDCARRVCGETLEDILDRFPEISGNTVNGLGETEWRPPSPFFWHPADRQTHGELQAYIVSQFTLLYMPMLFIVFGILLDIIAFIALYGWVMSWKRKTGDTWAS